MSRRVVASGDFASPKTISRASARIRHKFSVSVSRTFDIEMLLPRNARGSGALAEHRREALEFIAEIAETGGLAAQRADPARAPR
jgi:hypothetical protein